MSLFDGIPIEPAAAAPELPAVLPFANVSGPTLTETEARMLTRASAKTRARVAVLAAHRASLQHEARSRDLTHAEIATCRAIGEAIASGGTLAWGGGAAAITVLCADCATVATLDGTEPVPLDEWMPAPRGARCECRCHVDGVSHCGGAR